MIQNRSPAEKPMTALVVLVTGLLALALVLPGCTATCGATAQRLAALRRGMSYEQTAEIMGCPGTFLTRHGPDSGDFATVEWDGPVSPVTGRTQIDFLDDKLLSYTTGRRGGL